jgi:glycosyltransferase involved in cell wall biosynthesis
MSLSIIIPAKNEEKNIVKTYKKVATKLEKNKINFEVIAVDDFSNDKTLQILNKIKKKNLKILRNKYPGVGNAIKIGIKKSKKKYTCILMADASDDINNLITYYKLMKNEKIDGVFGSRFLTASNVKNYPFLKLILNRLFNKFTQIIFFSNYNDFTNAFKIYNSKKLLKIFPLYSKKFDIFLEIPLKFYIKKNRFKIIPINWYGRKKGFSKFLIKELSFNYLRALLNCLKIYYL